MDVSTRPIHRGDAGVRERRFGHRRALSDRVEGERSRAADAVQSDIFGRLVKGSGLVVKTRAGLTTFGEGLTDDEVRYLHALVRRALAGTTG